MTRKIWWGDFTTREFEALDPEAVVAVLPVAAVEQHGPHLPLSTDLDIMNGMLDTAISLLPATLDVRILPVQAVGKSDEHIAFPGTLTVDPVSLIGHWTALGDSVSRTGIRKMVIVNSHGGNEEVVGIVARQLRLRYQMLAVRTSWERFGTPEGLFSDREKRFGIHGGDYETSLMLHFRPELVKMEEAADFRSTTERAKAKFKHLSPQSPHGFAWLAGDLNAAGAVGEAHLATAEKGRATAQWQARGFVELLQEVRDARLGDLLQ